MFPPGRLQNTNVLCMTYRFKMHEMSPVGQTKMFSTRDIPRRIYRFKIQMFPEEHEDSKYTRYSPQGENYPKYTKWPQPYIQKHSKHIEYSPPSGPTKFKIHDIVPIRLHIHLHELFPTGHTPTLKKTSQ